MSVLTVLVHVSSRAAIVAGKTAIGSQSFNVTADDLQTLSEPLRLELALALEGKEPLGMNPDEPAVIEPSLAAIRPILEARAAKRAQLVEEQRKLEARAAEAAAVSAREATAKDNARSKALRAWVEKHGDDEQKARMAEGFLREDEILQEVCDELLDIPALAAYEPLRRGDACDCGCAHRVQFHAGTPRHLDSFQFEKLTNARAAVPEGAAVVPVEHRAACPACKCVPIARIEARVSMSWNGWLLVKQYSID